ncbi:hypothetical protein Tco_0225536 [Tanacetum coccineum]
MKPSPLAIKMTHSETQVDPLLRWKTRCAAYFPYSTYFEGPQCSTHAANKDCKQAHTENGSIESFPSNGKVEKLDALKNLTS